jgi:hypothetical protein
VAANLHGVWAKWERAVEQLAALDTDVAAFCAEPNPYGVISQSDREAGRYRFEIKPAWQPGVPYRWGAIIGEIVHDFRSTLDNLIWQLAILNGGKTYSSHTFPLLTQKPKKGFAVQMRRERIKNGKTYRGPLFGLGDDAVAIIESCQPYIPEDGVLLRRLHDLWNLDKHRHLAPIHVEAAPARLIPEGVTVLSRDDRVEGSTYVLEVAVAPGTDVDVDLQPPTDVTLGDGAPVVCELKTVGEIIMLRLLIPAGGLSPGMLGFGMPNPQAHRRSPGRASPPGVGSTEQ